MGERERFPDLRIPRGLSISWDDNDRDHGLHIVDKRHRTVSRMLLNSTQAEIQKELDKLESMAKGARVALGKM